MNSPFPGMDPYLEPFWGDIHARLVLYACDQLEDQSPGKLIVRVQERLVVEGVDEDNRNIFPDVRISEQSVLSADGAVAVKEGMTATEPIIVRYTSEPATETFINILEPGTRNRLITVIEILSPSNKVPGEGQLKYKKKQTELKKAKVSSVEIDLLRGQSCLRIPLRKKDQDIRLDLQAIFEMAYRKGRYFSSINYEEPPEPPLKGMDAAWAGELLRKLAYHILLLPFSPGSQNRILIRKTLVNLRLRQFHKKRSQTLHQNVHEAAAFVGGRGGGVAQAGVFADQVPRAGDADPAAIDGLEARRRRGAVVRQLGLQ